MRPNPEREHLLAQMATGIGASECHHLFSLPPYGCARRLWYKKTRHPEDFPEVPNRDMQRGIELESLVRRKYAALTHRSAGAGGFHRHPKYPYLICHPDGLLLGRPLGKCGIGGRTPAGHGYLEIKCPNQRSFLRIKREGLPEPWILQIQHGLLVTDWWWATAVVFSAELWELLHFDLKPNRELQSTILQEAEKFWRRVDNGPAPERLPPDDRRCQGCPYRTTCQGEALLRLRDQEAEGEDLPEDGSLVPLVLDYQQTRELVSEAEALQADARERLALALGDRTAVQCVGARVYYRPQERATIDAAALRRDHPDLASQYERRSVYRSLKVIGGDP